MATIKKGTYRWNDVLNIPISTEYELPFTCDGENYLSVATGGTDASVDNTYTALGYVGSEGYVMVYILGEFNDTTYNGWLDNKYQIITVTADTEADDAFATWFDGNTSPVSTEVTEASVKAKIQSLITKANTTTGKSDTDLTGAVLSLAEGYGQGGSTECDGCIIEVDTLPTENIDENALYLCDDSYHKWLLQFTDLVVSIPDNDVVVPIHELFAADPSLFNYIYVKTKPTENIFVSEETGFYIYYVEDEDNVFAYGDFEGSGNMWLPGGTLIALLLQVELPFNGFVSDETLATEFGLYAIGGNGWQTYAVPKGEMTITENGEYNVAGLKTIVADVPNAVINGVWTINTEAYAWSGYTPFECNVNCTVVYNEELKHCTTIKYEKDSKNRPNLYFITVDGETIQPVVMGSWNYTVSQTVDFGLEPQIVPTSLRAMFEANATRQESGVSDEVLTLIPSTEKQIFNSGVYYKNVVVDAIQTQTLEVGVAATDTTYTPDDGKFFSSVKVKAADISDPSTLHQLCGISLKSFPKTRYVDGDIFISVIGGVLCCCYTDGSTVDVNLQYDMVRNLDIWSGVGTRIATVEYTEGGITCQTTYLYTVTDGTEPDNPLPIEIATETEMNSLLNTAEVGSIYKYTGTTGTYENGALYVVEVILISFTIVGETYRAEEGMTWAEWVADTTYNTVGAYVEESTTLIRVPFDGVLLAVTDTNDKFVTHTDKIIANTAYGLHMAGGGSN